MLNSEKYYKDAYEFLDLLDKRIKNGYEKTSYTNFFYEIKQGYNYKVKQNVNYLQIAMIIALLAINKEKIEKTEKNTDYNISNVFNDIRKSFLFQKNVQKEIDEFESKKVINTNFDNWLSVELFKNADNNSNNVLEFVRNSLLHGAYEPILKEIPGVDLINKTVGSSIFPTIHIENKSFFKADILNLNFFQFVFSYFGNIGCTMSDSIILLFEKKVINIIDEQSLNDYLNEISAIEISYKMETDYNGNNTLEAKMFEEIYQKNETYDAVESILKINEIVTEKTNNGTISNVSDKVLEIDDSVRECIKNYINLFYKEEFYSLNNCEQRRIIHGLLSYSLENPKVLSNQIISLYAFINNLIINYLDLTFLEDDKYETFATEPTLLIVRAYLILYRLQYKGFDEVDYSNIDLDYNKIKLEYKNIDGSTPTSNYFLDDFNKLKAKSNGEDDEFIYNKSMCYKIRNALAHGNVETKFITDENGNLNHYIVLNDIYKGKIRTMEMNLDTFRKFVYSKAFLPEYCLTKEKDEEKKLILK